MRLVGTDSQGEAMAVQFLKHLPDSRIKVCAFQRAFRISGKKVPMNILHQFPGRLAPDATSYEHSATVSYERLYPAGGMGGESMIVEGLIEAGGNSRQGINQGPVEIEDSGPDHARAFWQGPYWESNATSASSLKAEGSSAA